MTIRMVLPNEHDWSPEYYRRACKMLRGIEEIASRCGIPEEWSATLSMPGNMTGLRDMLAQLTIGWDGCAVGEQLSEFLLTAMRPDERIDFIARTVEHCCHRLLTGVMRERRKAGK